MLHYAVVLGARLDACGELCDTAIRVHTGRVSPLALVRYLREVADEVEGDAGFEADWLEELMRERPPGLS